MSKFNNKTAVISGGAEGIGLSIAKALGAEGMNIVLGDISGDTLAVAEQALIKAGVPVAAVRMDVTKQEDWQQLVNVALDTFGKIHMLVNNAGVASAPHPVEETDFEDWRWVIDVNLMGVVMGAAAVIPHLKEHGEGGWLLNVASMAGMGGVAYGGAYTATKVAVVGMTEAWHEELEPDGIQVAALCPAFVQTRIHLSARNRQDEYNRAGKAQPTPEQLGPVAQMVENGIPVDLVGQRVIEALQAGEMYIFTHPGHRKIVAARSAAIDDAFARAATSPLLQNVPSEESFSFG